MRPITIARPNSLFAKVALSFVAVVAVPLVLLSASTLWSSADEQRQSQRQIQQLQADAAADRIADFISGIRGHLGWATSLPWEGDGDVSTRRLDALRILRQTPAVTDLAILDDRGRERLVVSRLALDRTETRTERGAERAFVEALSRGVHHGPISFRQETEPFMTLAVAGPRREMGVAIAEVNLTFIWDVVSGIRVGRAGRAWVADDRGRLIAHPDMSYVLSRPDVSARVRSIVDQVDAAVVGGGQTAVAGLDGSPVRIAYAVAKPMGWHVMLELPEAEATAPLRRSVQRAGWVALGSFALAVTFALMLARRLLRPIRALTEGAIRLGRGDLGHRIEVRTGDELEALGQRFNTMAAEVQSSYADLERKVAERTQALAAANAAKTLFLAAASHDLRQPLHALNLLVGQLRAERSDEERSRVGERIESALADINGLFDGLLDVSRLDAGTVRCEPRDVPLAPLLARVRAVHEADARAKGLDLRVARCNAWVRTDPQLLERVLLNLVGNAIRYTDRGGVLVGSRRRGHEISLEVRDSGVGIPIDQQQRVFEAFVQLGGRSRPGGEGLGLGLAIVRRLVDLLGHPMALRSAPGRGTCCSLRLPLVAPGVTTPTPVHVLGVDCLAGREVLILDDDERVQQGTAGLLRTWGCTVIVASSAADALERLQGRAPALMIVDLHLDNGELGSDAVAGLRARLGLPVPALLVTGDIGSAARERARDAGFHVLDKPVQPMTLRALASRVIAQAVAAKAKSIPNA